jgi:hypothetical protein
MCVGAVLSEPAPKGVRVGPIPLEHVRAFRRHLQTALERHEAPSAALLVR